MIRVADTADLPAILEMAEAFHGYSPWSVYPFDRAATTQYAINVMAAGVILISDAGMVGGLVNPVPFAPTCKVAAELFWWGDGSLRAAFEAWAASQGATACQFSALADDRSPAMARLFGRAGYRPVETGYLKDL